MAPFFAHSPPDGKPPPAGWQLLADHLRAVADRAGGFAQEMRFEISGISEAAYAAGLLHDLGNYSAFNKAALAN